MQQNLQEWLEEKNLGDFHDKLTDLGFSAPSDLKGCTEAEIKELLQNLGIVKLGLKRRIANAVESLNDNDVFVIPLTQTDLEQIQLLREKKALAESTCERFEKLIKDCDTQQQRAFQELNKIQQNVTKTFSDRIQHLSTEQNGVNDFLQLATRNLANVRLAIKIKDIDELDDRSARIVNLTSEVYNKPLPSTEAFESNPINADEILRISSPTKKFERTVNLTVIITCNDIEMNFGLEPNTKLFHVRGIIALHYPTSTISNQKFYLSGNPLEDDVSLKENGICSNDTLYLKSTNEEEAQNFQQLQERLKRLEGELVSKNRLIEHYQSFRIRNSKSSSQNRRHPERTLSSNKFATSTPKREARSFQRGEVYGSTFPQTLLVSGAEEYSGIYALQKELWNNKPLYKKSDKKCIRWYRNAWLIDDKVRDEPLGVAVWRKSTRHPGIKGQQWIVFKDNQWTDCSDLLVQPIFSESRIKIHTAE